MLSLILPYWQRQAAADRALKLLETQYVGMDLEVVVVDDGDPTPYQAPDTTLDLKVIRLPEKSGPKNTGLPWNAGVSWASGDLIALSCVEVLHTTPVLQQMVAHVRELGPQGYVLAAAWCPEHHDWHCHSTKAVPTCPPGTGLSFLGVMHRDLYFAAGGFDDDYRDGAGYEDRDFIWRMVKAGAQFVIRDDLVVTHPKTGATIKWGGEAFNRNAELYKRKWASLS